VKNEGFEALAREVSLFPGLWSRSDNEGRTGDAEAARFIRNSITMPLYRPRGSVRRRIGLEM
jgi:hypothetical protein